MTLALYCISVISWGVFFASLTLQYALGLEPCPLCVMQRFTVLLLAICFSIWLWRTYRHGALWQKVPAACAAVLTMCGLYFSLRQLWLQSLPPELVPACMPSLSIMLDFLPWQTIAKTLILGAGDCAEQGFLIAGLSLAAWSSLYFSGLALCLVYLYCATFRNTT